MPGQRRKQGPFAPRERPGNTGEACRDALKSSFALAFLEASDGALSGLSRPSGRKRTPEEIAAAVTAATVPVVAQ